MLVSLLYFNIEELHMPGPKKPTLAELGLDEAVDVQSLISSRSALDESSLGSESQAVVPDTKKESAFKETRKPMVIASPIRSAEQQSYPWLFRYMMWLKVMGILGNVLAAVLLILGYLMIGNNPEEGIALMGSAVMSHLSFNFLFVIKALVQLLIDAKRDLSEICNKLDALRK